MIKLFSRFERFYSRVPRTMMIYRKFFKEKMASDAMREFVKHNKEAEINRLLNSKEVLLDILDLLVAAEAFKKQKKEYNDYRSDLIKFLHDLEIMTRPIN